MALLYMFIWLDMQSLWSYGTFCSSQKVSWGCDLLSGLLKKNLNMAEHQDHTLTFLFFACLFSSIHLACIDVRAVGVEELCRCISECQFTRIVAGSHYIRLLAKQKAWWPLCPVYCCFQISLITRFQLEGTRKIQTTGPQFGFHVQFICGHTQYSQIQQMYMFDGFIQRSLLTIEGRLAKLKYQFRTFGAEFCVKLMNILNLTSFW